MKTTQPDRLAEGGFGAFSVLTIVKGTPGERLALER